MSANHCEILPHRSVGEKLLDQCVSIRLGLGKEQNAGGKAVDAVDDKGPLSFRSQFRGNERPCGRSIGAFDRHGWKSGWFVDGHDGVVFVEHRTVR